MYVRTPTGLACTTVFFYCQEKRRKRQAEAALKRQKEASNIQWTCVAI